jgi:CHASE3 domain sensor protein
MSPSSKRILFIALPVVMVLAIIIGVFSLNNEARFKDTSDSLKRSYRLRDQSDATYSQVQSMESSSDNYLFTGDINSLSDFNAGVIQIRKSIDTLKYMTRDEPILKTGVDSLAMLIKRHILFIDSYLNVVKAKEFSKEELVDYVRFNKYYRDRINTILSEIMIEQNGQFRDRELENAKSISSYHWIFLPLRIGTFLLLISMIILLIRKNNKHEKG